MDYAIEISLVASQYFQAFLSMEARDRVARRIDALARKPRPKVAHAIAGPIRGLYRIGSGEERVLYRVRDEELYIVILRIGVRDAPMF